MAKVPFSKLQAVAFIDVGAAAYTNKSGEEVNYEVKKYLPIKEKLEMITRIVNLSVDSNGFYNPMRVKIYTTLEIVYTYTNLNFTDKMKEDPFKLYDILITSGIYFDIINIIGTVEIDEIKSDIKNTIENIYTYRNSAMGILDNLKTDYSNLNFDLESLQNNISDPNNLTLLKEIMDLSGLNS
jgi:hypothetical protein